MSNEKDTVIGLFGKGWVEQNPDAVMGLISKNNLQYFESTFATPNGDWQSVKKLWDVVTSNQKDVTWWHELLVEGQDKALAHVKVTRTLLPSGEAQVIDAAFLFGFDENGKINYFRQWRMLAE